MQLTFTLTIICSQCGQLITEQEFQQANWQFILPNGIFQHRTCPKPPCHFSPCSLTQTIHF